MIRARAGTRPSLIWLTLCMALICGSLQAAVSPAEIEIPEAEAWTGQRLPLYVKLRAKGSFSGAASFSIPEIPGTMILKVGNPTVGSETHGGESWFVQTHEFALFSQRNGEVKIPAFEVRFGSRDGFTGPANEQTVKVPGTSVNIKRPPGTEPIAFLITTSNFEAEETWDSTPSQAEAGTVLKRTLTQRADQVAGMALTPAPTDKIPGVRLYPGKAEVTDNTQRGNFSGQRRETITYLLQKPGQVTLPAITYYWWDPSAEKLLSKEFPALEITVTPSPEQIAARKAREAAANPPPPRWPWLAASAFVLSLVLWQRRQIHTFTTRLYRKLNPAEAKLARKLLHACKQQDPAAANQAWQAWRQHQVPDLKLPTDLTEAIQDLQRHLYAPTPTPTWQAAPLAKAFQAHRKRTKTTQSTTAQKLPPLNQKS